MLMYIYEEAATSVGCAGIEISCPAMSTFPFLEVERMQPRNKLRLGGEKSSCNPEQIPKSARGGGG